MKRQCEYERTIDDNGQDSKNDIFNMNVQYSKWKRDLDKEFKTVTWLKCEAVMECGRMMVTALKCSK